MPADTQQIDASIAAKEYARPDALVSTEWLAAHLDDPNIRIVESDEEWFVLRYLLGYEKVRNYDGSWTEWGNAVRAPIER